MAIVAVKKTLYSPNNSYKLKANSTLAMLFFILLLRLVIPAKEALAQVNGTFLKLTECRSEGYKANMKILGDAKEMCLSIAKGIPTLSGAKAISFTHVALGSSPAWLEQLKLRCETIAASYIRHEEANMFCIKAIMAMEDKMKETEEAVCQVQAILGYTTTQQSLEKCKLGKDLPLVHLQYPSVRRQITTHNLAMEL